MWPAIKRFFLDETAFKGYLRSALLTLGGIVLAYPDFVPTVPKWAGIVLMAGAGMIRAGEKNPR